MNGNLTIFLMYEQMKMNDIKSTQMRMNDI